MPLISTLISALFITIVLIPFLMRRAVKYQLVDAPNERKVHTQLVPRVGGIAMVTGMLIPFLVWFPKDSLFMGILTGIAILAFFGIWDDRRDLNYRLKFAGQMLAAIAVVAIGDLKIEWIPFLTSPIESQWISLPLTVFCLLAITNAMNLSDGLDGLAGGSSILSFGVVGLIAFSSGSYSVVILTLAVAGSILGFLRFNSHPARIFMGDTGSQFLGFVLGILVILITQKINSALSPVLPLLIFGLPVIDTVTVMVKRIMEGRSPFSPDKNHIHHRLLACGFSHYETVVLLYFIQFIFVLFAFFLRFYVDIVVVVAFLSYSAMILMGIHLALKNDWIRKYDLHLNRLGAVSGVSMRSYIRIGSVTKVIQVLLLLTLLVYSVSSSLNADTISTDIAILAACLSLLAFLNLFLAKKQQWADAISMYTACALLAYLGFVQGSYSEVYRVLDWLLVVMLGGAVWSAVMLSTQRMFETSPLDFLVILVAVLAPLLFSQYTAQTLMTLAIIKFVVLLYAFEYVRNGDPVRDMLIVRGTVAASMLVIGSSLLW